MDFYPADWLLGTMSMSAEARGAYIDLLCHAWDQGTIPADDTKLHRLARVDAETWARVRNEVLAKFVETRDGRLRHRRVDAELRRAKQRSKIASSNARKRYSKTANAAKRLSQLGKVAADLHCQNDAIQQLPTKDSESLTNLPSLDSVPSESETHTVPSAKPKTRRNEYPEAFQQFWLAYPRRSTDTKAAAFKAWDKQRKAGTDLSELHAGAERYAEYAARTGCETAHVQTWINRQGWTASYAIKGNGHAASNHRPSAEQEFWRRHAGPADVGAHPPVAAHPPPRRG